MEDNNDVKYDLTGKKIIPLNAPIGFANTTTPTTLPFQAVEKGQSVSEGLCAGQGIPYFEDPTPAILEEIESLLSDTTNQDNESSVKINKLANILKSMLTSPVVNPNAVPTTLKMMLDMYNTISQPVALLSMGAFPEWSQSVIDNNGGYPKGFVIREIETGENAYKGYYVCYISLVDNNINPQPTLTSHTGWGILYLFVENGSTNIVLMSNYSSSRHATFSFDEIRVPKSVSEAFFLTDGGADVPQGSPIGDPSGVFKKTYLSFNTVLITAHKLQVELSVYIPDSYSSGTFLIPTSFANIFTVFYVNAIDSSNDEDTPVTIGACPKLGDMQQVVIKTPPLGKDLIVIIDFMMICRINN